MKKYDVGGSFSDEFYNALNTAQQPEEDDNTQDEQTGDDEDSQVEEMLRNYQEDNEYDKTLSGIVDNDNIGEEDLMNPEYFDGKTNGQANAAIHMVLSNVSEDLGWLHTKDKSVNISNTNSKLAQYLNSLPTELRTKLVATSGNDSDVHVKGSKHYNGDAVDLRFNPEVYNYIMNDPSFSQEGLKMLPPDHGTAKHIHIETKKLGGKYKC